MIKRIRREFPSLSSTGQHDALEFVDLLIGRLRFEIQSHTGYIEREITSTGHLLVLSLARFDHTTRTKDHRAVQLEESLLITEQLRYQLKGIVCHHGYDFRSGHYTAWVNHHGQWFECSDETVVQHDIHDNPELARSCVIFFYNKCSAMDVIEVNAAQEFVLTPAQDREVDKAFQCKSTAAVVAEVNNIQVRSCDLQTLKGDDWLNDIVIDAFMQTACNLRKEKVLDRYMKRIRFYDPLSGRTLNDKVKEVRAFLRKRDAQLGTNHFEGISAWAVEDIVYQLQEDASSCGVFVCLYAMQEYGIVAAMDQINIRTLRRYIAFRLLENKAVFDLSSDEESRSSQKQKKRNLKSIILQTSDEDDTP
ncbi:Ubiquitin carboxyl-terminal hydrolase 3 [Branchiostoma belcheri]|nr:Ubiquitin carboxyl-terminal hydrolase 3 [Branchiostoma belcheri]